MNGGSPDYTRKVKIYAMYNDTLVPVTVDSEGRIIMIPYGTLEVEGDVNVTQVDSVREIQGKDGVTLRTIAVDNAGRIVGVFKGDYLGELKTIKVDDEGRIIALITDELDIYGNQVIIGNAELAARLGSLKFFDRRGDVIFLESFENGLGRWALSGLGTGNDIVLTADRTRHGGYSAKLVGGSDDDREADMYTRLAYPVLSKWGFELHFAMGSNIDYLIFRLSKLTGSNFVKGEIKYDRTNQKLQYLDSNNVYQDIVTSFNLYQSEYLFHVFKLVLDFVNDKYHRLIVNETTYDLSAYDLRSTASALSKQITPYIEVVSTIGDNDYIYVDNVIITQNEPD